MVVCRSKRKKHLSTQFFTPADYFFKDAFTALVVSLEQRYSVLKIDTVTDLGKGWKLGVGAVRGVDGFIYGIP